VFAFVSVVTARIVLDFFLKMFRKNKTANNELKIWQLGVPLLLGMEHVTKDCQTNTTPTVTTMLFGCHFRQNTVCPLSTVTPTSVANS
jgi:hypothetical protein